MCPVCLATMGLYVAGGVSAGGMTTYLATRLLNVGRKGTNDERHPKEGEKSDDRFQRRAPGPDTAPQALDPRVAGVCPHLPPFPRRLRRAGAAAGPVDSAVPRSTI